MKRKPQAMRYYGGKGKGKAKWINSHLPPPVKRQVYAEPYGGMAGVLLQREKAGFEIYNDLSDRLYNWWICIRDEPTEFARLVEYTPRCERMFREAAVEVDNPKLPPVRRALAFYQLLAYSLMGGGRWQGIYAGAQP